MFEAFTGSVPRIVPDNLKTGVTRHPTEGEIVLNDAYRHMAAHYSAAVLPGRVRKPKDKASVENTVGHIATWVIAGLRHSTYTSLNELRQAIRERVHAYNAQPFQKRAGSRTSVFREQEQPAASLASRAICHQHLGLRAQSREEQLRLVQAELLFGSGRPSRGQRGLARH